MKHINININIEALRSAFTTLIHSWGSEAPSEAIWAANEFAAVLCPEFKEFFVEEIFSDPNEEIDNEQVLENLIEKIQNKIT